MKRGQLPASFCWTRFGTEAGQGVERIFGRKERERRGNGGTFYWGIGNSVAAGIAELIGRDEAPEVLFSPIRGVPRPVDVVPGAVVKWRAGIDLDGKLESLPPEVCVISGRANAKSTSPHYALVCSSQQPLSPSDHGRLRFGELRNLRSGIALGASQVTAVVSRVEEGSGAGSEYIVALRVDLVAPYFVRLADPVVLGHEQRGLEQAA